MHPSPLPDLVKDSRLQATFHGETTVHRLTSTDSHGRRVRSQEQWKIERHLGHGSYGRVWKEMRVPDDKDGEAETEIRAVKMILKPQHASKAFDYNRELEAIAKFSHQKYESRFVKSFGWYESRQAIFIAMEFMGFGDLQKYMPAPGDSFSAHDTQDMISQILEGLSYMHENGFAHRDLKPANILVKSMPPENEKWWIKIGDLGISKRATDEHDPSTIKGTVGFMSPELLLTMHSSGSRAKGSFAAQPTDMWALGEIALRMITGEPSFKNLLDMLRWMETPNLEFLHSLQTVAADEAFDFIQKLLSADPAKRLSAKQALRHPWIDPNGEASDSDSDTASYSGTTEQHWPQYPEVDGTFKTDEPSAKWSTLSGATSVMQSSWQDVTLRPGAVSEQRLSTGSVGSTFGPRTAEIPVPSVRSTSPSSEVSQPPSPPPADNEAKDNGQDIRASLSEHPSQERSSNYHYKGFQNGGGGFLLGRNEIPLESLGGPSSCKQCQAKLLWTDLFKLRCDKCDFSLDSSEIPPSLLKVHEDYETRMSSPLQHNGDAPLEAIEEEWSEQGEPDSEQSETSLARARAGNDHEIDSDAGSTNSIPPNDQSNSKETGSDRDDTDSGASVEHARDYWHTYSKSRTEREPQSLDAEPRTRRRTDTMPYGYDGLQYLSGRSRARKRDEEESPARATQNEDYSPPYLRSQSPVPNFRRSETMPSQSPEPVFRRSETMPSQPPEPVFRRSETMPSQSPEPVFRRSETMPSQSPEPVFRRSETLPSQPKVPVFRRSQAGPSQPPVPDFRRSETMPSRHGSSTRTKEKSSTEEKRPRSPSESEREKVQLAREAGVPKGFNLKNWDPQEKPIRLLGSVFDMASLGKWTFDWTFHHQGPKHPETSLAGELWLLLVGLAGRMDMGEKFMARVHRMQQHESTQPIPAEKDQEIVSDFLESNERLLITFKKLLRICENNMSTVADVRKGDNKTKLSPNERKDIGKEFVTTIFGREEELEATEKWMAKVRLWSMRWDAVCMDVVRSVKVTAIADREEKMKNQEHFAKNYIRRSEANERDKERLNAARDYIKLSRETQETRPESSKTSGQLRRKSRPDSAKKKKPGLFSRAFGAAA